MLSDVRVGAEDVQWLQLGPELHAPPAAIGGMCISEKNKKSVLVDN